MSFGYRQRIRTSRRTWLNVSKTGVSSSLRVGPVTVNSRGRARVRLPFGWFWRP